MAGAGLVGRRHMEAMGACQETALCAIADPDPRAKDLAKGEGVPWFGDLPTLLAKARPDGLILATPNAVHGEGARKAIDAGVPVLVEKPFVDDLSEGIAVVEAAEAARIPVLCGHHRRHNPLIVAAKERIAAGDLGTVVSVHASAWLKKPASYFEAEWRTKPGGGPIMINLIHDIDLMRHLAGEITAVAAMETNVVRGNPVEDAAAILVRFESGAVGTLSVTDTVPAPWSWELTAGENPAYPKTDAVCYMIGGTRGALELPAAALWRHEDGGSWWTPMTRTSLLRDTHNDPLVAQMKHFAAVVRGEETPRVTGLDGLKAVAIVEAIRNAARSGKSVDVAL
ncbi:MAG: Gfo/Idh/MocA family oxidoreductase [Pseudomonadota bacterium]